MERTAISFGGFSCSLRNTTPRNTPMTTDNFAYGDDLTDRAGRVGEQDQQVRNHRTGTHQQEEPPALRRQDQQLPGALILDVKPQRQCRSDLHHPHVIGCTGLAPILSTSEYAAMDTPTPIARRYP